jgi:hypothetical protein
MTRHTPEDAAASLVASAADHCAWAASEIVAFYGANNLALGRLEQQRFIVDLCQEAADHILWPLLADKAVRENVARGLALAAAEKALAAFWAEQAQ